MMKATTNTAVKERMNEAERLIEETNAMIKQLEQLEQDVEKLRQDTSDTPELFSVKASVKTFYRIEDALLDARYCTDRARRILSAWLAVARRTEEEVRN